MMRNSTATVLRAETLQIFYNDEPEVEMQGGYQHVAFADDSARGSGAEIKGFGGHNHLS